MRETLETQEITTVEKSRLLEECAAFAAKGMRLVQILAINSADGAELTYSFGKGFEMNSIRISVPSGESVPSITPIWRGAFLYENEIRDLFGVNIANISVDYRGNFYTVAKAHPFAAGTADAGAEGGKS